MKNKLQRELDLLCTKYPMTHRHFMVSRFEGQTIHFSFGFQSKKNQATYEAFRLWVVKAQLMGIKVEGWCNEL